MVSTSSTDKEPTSGLNLKTYLDVYKLYHKSLPTRGFELLQELRTNPGTQEIPIILLSARAGEESKVEGLDAGADDYLVKPFSAQELLVRVGSHLKLARIRRESLQQEQAARIEAETANRLKDEFLCVLSHEIRTPLNAILGWASMLRSGKLNQSTQVKALEVIERNARAQAQLIDDLLDVSRIIRGKLTLDIRPINLALVIEAAIETVCPAIEAKKIQLHTQLDPRAGLVLADFNRIQQIVWNLLINPAKFTPTGGCIEVELSLLTGNGQKVISKEDSSQLPITKYAQITVRDTGIGIAPQFLPFVFERFRQGNSTMSRNQQGLGLGLAIARHLVEAHGGTIHAESPGVGQGARFRVNIPLSEKALLASKR